MILTNNYRFCQGEECYVLIVVTHHRKKYCSICAQIEDRKKKKQLIQDKRHAQSLLRSWHNGSTNEMKV